MELARRERVPARIAKGELDGKMKCRIWRKLHSEEAQRFSEAYELMEKIPGIELADAFGIIQSGRTAEQFLARKSRTHQKQAILLAREKTDRSAIEAFLQGHLAKKTEMSIVLGTQTLIDTLVADEPIALSLGRHGPLEKIQLVLMTARSVWEQISSTIPRDSRLAKKPLPVAREPERRPVADPRPFITTVGKTVDFLLRNGIHFSGPVSAAGPFDLIVGEENREVLIPLHAIVSWQITEPNEEHP